MKKTLLAALLAASVLPALAADYYVVVPLKKSAEEMVKNISVALNTAALPGGLVGQAYAGFDFVPALRITGDPKLNMGGVTWRVADGALPAGLTLSADGKLTGTPEAAGTSNFQLQASYKTKSGSQGYQLVVGEIVIGLAAATLPDGLQGVAYAYNLASGLSVTGDPQYTPGSATWAVLSGLPAGLHLSGAGQLEGTPTGSGATQLQVQATYRGAVATRNYPLTIRVPTADFRIEDATVPRHDYGSVLVGVRSSEWVLTFRNAGTATGSLLFSPITGDHASDFTGVRTCTQVAPGATCQFKFTFTPRGAGTRTASTSLAGITLNFSGIGELAPAQYVLLTTGTSYRIPVGVNTVTAWAVGGGGGGGGAAGENMYAAGGGGAGGLASSTFQVTPAGTLTYTIGIGGNGGFAGSPGSSGGQTAVTYGGSTILANGGSGGTYESGSLGRGGYAGSATGSSTYSGGQGTDSYATNGYAFAAAGAGGGIGGAMGTRTAGDYYEGTRGGQAIYRFGLDTALTNAGQVLGAPGAGAPYSGQANINPGRHASGYGHGGGGAAFGGGNGGNGSLGGGGGGAAGYNQSQSGGSGGAGFIVLKLN